MKLSVIGTGYLGATHAAAMSSLGFTVVGIDLDAEKIAQLQVGDLPFYEPGLQDLLTSELASGRLTFTTDFAAAKDCDLHFICVGTPQQVDSLAADLTYVTSALESIAPHAKSGSLIVGKSTVPVGTADQLRARLAQINATVELAWNPEFLREGFAIEDTLRPNRIVVGVTSDRAEGLLKEVYAKLLGAEVPWVRADLPTAELVKVAANSFLATKISFINAMAEICEVAGGDVTVLARAIGYDPRIGSRFLQAGIGFGGGGPQPSLPNCIPCSDRPCDSEITDYLIRVFSFDNLEYVCKVKYQLRYAVTLKFLSTGIVEVYVAVQLYFRICVRYSFDITYYVNKNCPLQPSDCGIMNEPGSCTRYIDCDWDGVDWQVECGPLYRCESDGIQNSRGRMPGEEEPQQAFHCCDHAGCIADANISMTSCINDDSTFSATVYYGERYWEIVGLDDIFCPISQGATEGSCTCDSGTDGWYAQSTFRGTAAFTYDESEECICPAEFQVPEESRCFFDGDCEDSSQRTWPNSTFSWDPCIIAKCAVAVPFVGDPVPLSPDCCLDTDTTPAPTTIDLRPLDPGNAVYVTLNCT